MKRRRRSSRSRFRKPDGVVELNFAAMLDMAFQLLAFFVLTFTPPDVEIQISMLMPLATTPITQPPQASEGNSAAPPEVVDDFPLDVVCYSTTEGLLQRIVVGGNTVEFAPEPEMMKSLTSLLDSILKIGGVEVINLKVHSDLKYELLIRIVDVCTLGRNPQAAEPVKLSITQLKD